jgi:hypothetical protein
MPYGAQSLAFSRPGGCRVGSRANLIKLLPRLAHLQVFDNSVDAAPGEDIPDPNLVLEMVHGRMVFPEAQDATVLNATPEWARPIVQGAIESQPSEAGAPSGGSPHPQDDMVNP